MEVNVYSSLTECNQARLKIYPVKHSIIFICGLILTPTDASVHQASRVLAAVNLVLWDGSVRTVCKCVTATIAAGVTV